MRKLKNLNINEIGFEKILYTTGAQAPAQNLALKKR